MVDERLVILTKETIDRFLKLDNSSDLIALYVFYHYTAKWQKTNQPKCTTDYTANGLGWSEARVRKIKKQLIDMGIVEDVTTTDKGKVTGHYIKLNYILKESTVSDIEPHLRETTPWENHSVENHETNALSTNNKMLKEQYINADKRKKFVPPTLEEVEEYAKEKALVIDSKFFYEYFTEGDWHDAKGNPVKNWKTKMLTWNKQELEKHPEKANQLPSSDFTGEWNGEQYYMGMRVNF